ncbi:MAG: transglycosylase SLT domain-containing protein [Brachymonas sp.]|nr:transglycosylase SLT domain-containing protein [Brachymonas sp.]
MDARPRTSSVSSKKLASRRKPAQQPGRMAEGLALLAVCLGLGLTTFSAAQGRFSAADEAALPANQDVLVAQADNPAEFDTAPVTTPAASDEVILAMAQAYRSKNSATLTSLLPQATGHVLEPWAAYWELNTRLPSASAAEVDAFLQRYAGSYQEDRLRNDWLLQLGQSGDTAAFARYYPAFRMRDDQAVRCYAIQAAQPLGISREEAVLMLREAWFSRSGGGSACIAAASRLYAQGGISAQDIWHKARDAAERRQASAAREAVAIVDADAATQVPALFANPESYLFTAPLASGSNRELAVLAVARLAALNPGSAAQWLQGPAVAALTEAQRDWAWGSIGRQAALNLDLQTPNYFAQVRQLRNLGEDHLGWMARNALRHGQWPVAQRAIEAMPAASQQEPVWAYWLARSLQNGAKQPAQRPPQAERLLRSIAGNYGFYELLAQEELQGRITMPRAPAALSVQGRATMRAQPGIQRAFYARNLGLNSEATREWNYHTNLHLHGGMNDRDLLRAADLACSQQWWDRCINTSERTRDHIHMQQRFPMPYRNTIVGYSQQTGIDPAWVLGLIRQESRFAPAARSHVGASGLMQVMPGTARAVARKLGLGVPPSLNSIEGNVQLGTAYLAQQVQGEFGGSMAMASAAYNAGPGRPRRWREGPVQEGAIWAENIPFGETRDYVKKVLANSVNYALLLQPGQRQSLYGRLGTITPAPVAVVDNPADALPEPAGVAE